MNQSALYNLSGRVIPVDASIAILGEPKSGDVLVIESFDGINGTAKWCTAAALKTRRAGGEKVKSTAEGHLAWPPPLKPKAPYS